MSVNGVVRNYQQYLPTGFDPANESPSLLIILHGLGGNSSQMVGAGFNLIADTARVVAIYPQGKPNQFGQNGWNNGTLLASNVDDLGFMNQLIDSAIVHYNVNPARVYFTGFSMGSIMSYHMACELNNRVAAIGCMAGTMATSDIQNCVPTYATPVIHLHGTADGTVPYDSNPLPSLSLVPETVSFGEMSTDAHQRQILRVYQTSRMIILQSIALCMIIATRTVRLSCGVSTVRITFIYSNL